MKFLSKKADSIILNENLQYKRNADNSRLRELLTEEQSHFCAYTEKCLEPLDSVEVEHMDASIKFSDDYYNYYAVIRTANLFKQDEKYRDAGFLKNRFFQREVDLLGRIGFENNIYYEIDEKDYEARDFIDFLNLNHPKLSEQRKNHVKKLRSNFDSASYSKDEIFEYFSKHRTDLSFITAIEKEFGFSLIQLARN